MSNGRTNNHLDDALEREEARILAYVARNQGVEAAHKLSSRQSRDQLFVCLCATALSIIMVVWFTDLAPWIKWSVSGIAVLPMFMAPVLAAKKAVQLDEIREQRLREHMASSADQKETNSD